MSVNLNISELSIIRILLIFLFISGTSITNSAVQGTADECESGSVTDFANEVITAIEAKNGAQLAPFIHTELGVLFSPSAYVDRDESIVMMADQVTRFWHIEEKLRWGYEEGTGNPIDLTPQDYMDKYIAALELSSAAEPRVDRDTVAGTTTYNNINDIFPTSVTLEYRKRELNNADEKGEYWRAVRFVMLEENCKWWLIALVNDARSF